MRATSVAAVGCSALALVACGSSGRKRHAQRPAQLVGDAVAALQHDLLTRNWAHICAEVFSSQARLQAGGDDCPDFVRRGAAGLRGERIRVRSIDVLGRKASANVVTTAEGQAPVAQTIELVFENGRFRIDALAR